MINQEADMYSRAMEKYRGKCEELEAKNGELEKKLAEAEKKIQKLQDERRELIEDVMLAKSELELNCKNNALSTLNGLIEKLKAEKV